MQNENASLRLYQTSEHVSNHSAFFKIKRFDFDSSGTISKTIKNK